MYVSITNVLSWHVHANLYDTVYTVHRALKRKFIILKLRPTKKSLRFLVIGWLQNQYGDSTGQQGNILDSKRNAN